MPPPLETYQQFMPQRGEGAFVHASAQVIGRVTLGRNVSIWCNAVLRGDVNSIVVGDDSNVQDGSVLHVSHTTPQDPLGAPLVIGKRVTIGHAVILHGCTIGDECLIGMGSIVMDKAVIESRVLLGAGSLVPEGKRLESGNLYLGRPAKRLRELTAEEIAYFEYSAQHYVALQRSYMTR